VIKLLAVQFEQWPEPIIIGHHTFGDASREHSASASAVADSPRESSSMGRP
jgi:hypothetical protein